MKNQTVARAAVGLAAALFVSQSWGGERTVTQPPLLPIFPDERPQTRIVPEAKQALSTNGPFAPVESQAERHASVPKATAELTIADWPEASRGVAQVLLEKYGKPSSFDENALVWNQNGPFLKTVVFRDSDWFDAHRKTRNDVVQQTISCMVPAEKVWDLATYDTRIVADPSHHLLISTAESEDMNVLALNLAHEIITGAKTTGQARAFYEHVLELSATGKSSAYAAGLMFEPEMGEAGSSRD